MQRANRPQAASVTASSPMMHLGGFLASPKNRTMSLAGSTARQM
jgi:hypothetical protein